MPQWIQSPFEQLKSYAEHHQKSLSASAFFGGVIFDWLTVGRIDSPWTLLQQALFLTTVALAIGLETSRRFELSWFESNWIRAVTERPSLQMFISHFALGGLLSLYTIFYFKSASLVRSSLFLVILCALLVTNELPRFKRMGLAVRLGLFTLCLTSYLSLLIPILLGNLSQLTFWLAQILTASLVGAGLWFALKRIQSLTFWQRVRAALVPTGVIALWCVFYWTGLLPPVPLSLQFIGIYHHVQKDSAEGRYILQTERPWWKFWHQGDQDFFFRQGDSVYAFVRVFAPGEFEDQVGLAWYRKNPKSGWVLWDRIPLKIVGGREEGYRGYAYKSNYQEGEWQVRVEVHDGREIGRISLDLRPDSRSPDQAREMRKVFQ